MFILRPSAANIVMRSHGVDYYVDEMLLSGQRGQPRIQILHQDFTAGLSFESLQRLIYRGKYPALRCILPFRTRSSVSVYWSTWIMGFKFRLIIPPLKWIMISEIMNSFHICCLRYFSVMSIYSRYKSIAAKLIIGTYMVVLRKTSFTFISLFRYIKNSYQLQALMISSLYHTNILGMNRCCNIDFGFL